MASPQLQIIIQTMRERPVDKNRSFEQARADMEQLLQIVEECVKPWPARTGKKP